MDQIIEGAIYAARMVTIFASMASVIGFILFKFGLFSDIKREAEKKRKVARSISVVLGIMFMMLGAGKMIGIDVMIHLWNDVFQMGYMMEFTGALEFTLGFLLMQPKTFKLAVMSLNVSLGGAIVVHFPVFSDGPGAISGAIIVISFMWLSAVLYAPEMFPEFISKLFHKDYSENKN